MKRSGFRYAVLIFVMITATFVGRHAQTTSAQTTRPEKSFHSGQRVYIVAFRDLSQLVIQDPSTNSGPRESKENYLDLEKKVDEQLRKWSYFTIVDRPSDAEMILLVYTDISSIEGLAVSPDIYQKYYKDQFDLDELRDAAYVRATAGPLNIATLSRLTERMIKQMRIKIEGSAK